ncbi:hypothetical protein VMCG_08865 [Cytospora schulzeri]|uniref:Uncharacterized protein n=1 Tax=Cytospora schulzeri TaxID=448051 RepID=A0A423VUV6_9PEZI|nr:hypothetical protein VMCG_08865 [Valsa malicola]
MCKFTYLGYDRCDEPERHYLIRREKCSAKAHIKHWCAPHEQEEDSSANQQGKFWVSLPCPMCADTPVIYDQPLLEIAHSRRSVLPAPHYDAVTRKYTRLPKHQAPPDDLPESVIPKPLKTTRMQVRRAATETAVPKTYGSEHVSPPQDYTLPATTYIPPPQELKLPKPLPIPQPVTLTPPSSREGSRSPPQIRMDGALRTTPPGDGNRRELDSIREKARAAIAIAQESRVATPDRSRSGSASSSTSNESARPSQPSRQASNASTTTASSISSRATATTTSSRHRWHNINPSRPAQQDSVADTIANAALRSIGIDRNLSRSRSPSNSPERGRKPRRRPTGGSSSERSDSPSVWRPTISPPVLQNDSLGIGSILNNSNNNNKNEVEPFKQRLVPFPPVKVGGGGVVATATPNGASVAKGQGLVEDPPRPRTPHTQNSKTPALSLFPNAADDEEVAAAAFEKMQNTTDGVVSAAPSSKSSPQPGAGSVMKVKPGPLFSFAGVSGKAQEFEIITGPDGSILQDPEYGQAF